MSGTFMDGGGSGGDGGGTFMDGGGHDHSGHSGHAGDAGGFTDGGLQADGGALGNLLSHTAQNHNGFLAHILGLDHDGGHTGHAPGMHGTNGHVSQGAMWSSSLQSLKMSDFTAGLKFTPAMGMLCLFAGFIGWLFLLYAIRHNEPLANSILGTAPPSQGVGAYTDRRLINSMSEAMAIKTAKFAELHAQQDPDQQLQQQAQREEQQKQNSSFFNFSSPQPAATINNTESTFGIPQGNVADPNISAAPFGGAPFGGAGMSIAAPATSQTDSYVLPTMAQQSSFPGQINMQPGNLSKYAVSTVQSPNGRKLKFIVNN